LKVVGCQLAVVIGLWSVAAFPYLYFMKKILLAVFVVSLLSSCFIFRKKEKYGCPNDARNKSQEEILKDSNKKKYKGGKKF
jgi:hypothetical protein